MTMNKKVLLFIPIVLLIVVAGYMVFNLNNKNQTVFTIGEYQFIVNVETEKIDTTDQNVNFTALLKIRNENDKNTNVYHVAFLDFEADDIVYDMQSPDGQIQLNGKTLNYWCSGEIGSCENGSHEVLLYYPIDQNKSVPIKISGITIENDDGTKCKCLPIVGKDVLQSKELAKILNFKVKKIRSK